MENTKNSCWWCRHRKDPNNPTKTVRNEVDLNEFEIRYHNIPLWKNATLGINARYSAANKSKLQDNINVKSAWLGSFILRQNNFFGGFNQFTLQTATNSVATQLANIN